MDLRGGQTLWPHLGYPALTRPPADGPINCDVLIVGSGISGALLAFHLAEQGAEVVVVDRRLIAAGSTPASTALLIYDIDTPLLDLRRRCGQRNADAVYRRTRRSLTDFQCLGSRLDLDCSMIVRPSLYLAREANELPLLQEETNARREIGLEVEFLDETSLRENFGLRRPGAILSHFALEVDPWRLTNQLLLAAEEYGCRIYSQTFLSADIVHGLPHGWRAGCEHRIDARHIIWATGYETPELFTELRDLCQLNSTYVIGTQPLSTNLLLPQRALIWETGETYLYARTTADGRIIIGGEDEPFQNPQLRDSLIEFKSGRLLRKFNAVYPLANAEIATAWAGTFATTEDGLPYIGAVAKYPGNYFVLGYGGNGITYSLIAAQLLRDAIMGRINPDMHLFSFGRNSASSAPK